MNFLFLILFLLLSFVSIPVRAVSFEEYIKDVPDDVEWVSADGIEWRQNPKYLEQMKTKKPGPNIIQLIAKMLVQVIIDKLKGPSSLDDYSSIPDFVQWYSPDGKTWLQNENYYGNEQGESQAGDESKEEGEQEQETVVILPTYDKSEL